MIINPADIDVNIVVQPKITPSIKGIVFLNPKLNPEYEDIILLGPGVNAVTIPNKIKENKSEYIRPHLNHFVLVEMDEQELLFRLFQ